MKIKHDAAEGLIAGKRIARWIREARQRLLKTYRRHAGEEAVLRILNQAEEASWRTPYPHLVFPTLAMERIEAYAATGRAADAARSCCTI
jgi:hypothetical protein